MHHEVVPMGFETKDGTHEHLRGLHLEVVPIRFTT